jgi:hypothetical protein
MPVPGAVGVGITRGQDGAPVDDVQLDPNGNLVFYVQGVPIGQPIAIPAGAGGGLVGAAIEYNYSNAIIPAPNGNQFRLNSLDMTAVTEGYFHVTAANGSDVTHVLDMFKAGGRFLLQDHNDSSKYAVFDVTGPPQLGAAFRILLLAWVEGPGSFNNSQKTMMIIAKFSA